MQKSEDFIESGTSRRHCTTRLRSRTRMYTPHLAAKDTHVKSCRTHNCHSHRVPASQLRNSAEASVISEQTM